VKGWSAADVKRLEDAGRVRGVPALANPLAIPQLQPDTVKQGAPKRRGPNRWETRYHTERIAPQILGGEVTWCVFEGLSFNIGTEARPCWYTPDWPMVRCGRVRAVEVKGFMREAARLRLVAMTQRFPWVELVVVTREKGAWVETEWRATA